jgi:hypothetical protein
VFAFREHQRVGFLRPQIASGLIVFPNGRLSGREAGARRKRGQQHRAPRWIATWNRSTVFDGVVDWNRGAGVGFRHEAI